MILPDWQESWTGYLWDHHWWTQIRHCRRRMGVAFRMMVHPRWDLWALYGPWCFFPWELVRLLYTTCECLFVWTILLCEYMIHVLTNDVSDLTSFSALSFVCIVYVLPLRLCLIWCIWFDPTWSTSTRKMDAWSLNNFSNFSRYAPFFVRTSPFDILSVQGVGVFKYGSVDSVSVCMKSGGEGGTGKFCSVCVLWWGGEEREGTRTRGGEWKWKWERTKKRREKTENHRVTPYMKTETGRIVERWDMRK